MSEAMPLSDVLKSAPTASSLSGLSMLCVNSSGILYQSYHVTPTRLTPSCKDANDAPPGWSRTNQNTLNLPASGVGGYLLTLQYDTVAKMQLFFCWKNPPLVYARYHSSPPVQEEAEWKGWVVIAKSL